MSLDRLIAHIEKFQKRAEEEPEPPTLRQPPVAPPVVNTVPMEYQRFVRELEDVLQTKISGDAFNYWLNNVGGINIGGSDLKNLMSHYSWWAEEKRGIQYLEAVVSRSKVYRIFKSSQQFGDLQNAVFIPGAGVIPKLWLYVGDFAEKPMMNSSKELSHNFFIWEALSMMFGLSENQQDLTQVEEFATKHKAKLNKCRALFSYEPKELGAGSDGVAFDIGPSLVLKIFKDPTAYRAAKDAMHRLHSNPEIAKTEAMIYDADSIGDFNGSHIFFYVIEKVVPIHDLHHSLPNTIRPLIRKISEYLIVKDKTLRNLKKNLDKENDKTIKGIVTAVSESIASALSNDDSVEKINNIVPGLKPKWLVNFIEEIAMKYLTNRTDLHTGNLGLTNQGDLRYFDPAFEGFESQIHYGGGVVH